MPGGAPAGGTEGCSEGERGYEREVFPGTVVSLRVRSGLYGWLSTGGTAENGGTAFGLWLPVVFSHRPANRHAISRRRFSGFSSGFLGSVIFSTPSV